MGRIYIGDDIWNKKVYKDNATRVEPTKIEDIEGRVVYTKAAKRTYIGFGYWLETHGNSRKLIFEGNGAIGLGGFTKFDEQGYPIIHPGDP